MGPFAALNPHAIWIIVILVMAIGALGHIAVRLLGARSGLMIAGFASGFISRAATIAAMGARAAKEPDGVFGRLELNPGKGRLRRRFYESHLGFL